MQNYTKNIKLYHTCILLPSGKIKYLLRLDSVVGASIAFSDTQMARKWRHAKTRKRSRMPCIPRAPPRCDSHAFRCTMGRRPKGERKARKKLLPLLWNETKNRIRDSVGTLFPHWPFHGQTCKVRFQSPPGNGNVRPMFFHGSNEQTLATRSTIRSANNIYTCKCDIIHRLEVGGWLLYPGLERVSSIVKFWSSVYFYHFFFSITVAAKNLRTLLVSFRKIR